MTRKKAEILAFDVIVPAVCPFVVGLAVGSVGDMFSFWTAVALIFIFATLYLIYEWRNKNRLRAGVIAVGLMAFSVIQYFRRAPIVIGAIAMPGPDIGGLKRAGIEWLPQYTETVVELANPPGSGDYTDVDIEIGTSDLIHEVGETSSLKCVSLYGAQFLKVHKIRCPLLPDGGTIQLAVMTVIQINTPFNTPFGQPPPQAFVIPPQPPSLLTVHLKYNRGKRPYSKEYSTDPRREIIKN